MRILLLSAVAASALFLASSAQAIGPYTLELGVLVLDRSHPDSMSHIIDDLDAPVSNAQDISFDLSAGFQCRGEIGLHDGCSLIGEYFTNQWCDRLSRNAIGLYVDTVFVKRGELAATDLVTTFKSDFTSALSGIQKEVDDWLSFYVCYRHLSLDDEMFSQFSHGFIIDGVYRDTADNDLHGGEVGFNVNIYEDDGVLITSQFGCGVYHNSIDHWSYYSGGGGTWFYTEEESETSWSCDFQLQGVFDVNDFLQFGAGYRIIYIDNVALGTDQTGYTNYNTLSGTSADGDVVLQGLNIFAIITR